MSRTVSKILAICAMVVVIPLLIVGTAFVAFYSTDKTVNVSVYLIDRADDTAEGAVKSPELRFNQKDDSSHKITASQNKTLEVSALESKAYVFQGWFAGDATEYDAAVRGGEEITWASNVPTLRVEMQKAADEYVAVYDVVRYTISGWSYKLNPEADVQETVQAPETAHANGVYKYGEDLPQLTYQGQGENNDWYYAGWVVKGSPKNDDGTLKRYKEATFENVGTDGIVLTEPWQNVEMANVKFYEKGVEVLDQRPIRVGEDFKLPDARATSKETDKDGYRYFWGLSAEGSDEITDGILHPETADEVINVYIHKEAITYKATVVAEGATYSASTENITFTRDNYTALEGLFVERNWTLDSKFWEFEGLTCAGTTYTSAEEFVNAYVHAEANKTESTTATLTVNVVKNYTQYESGKIEFRASQGSDEASIPVQHFDGNTDHTVDITSATDATSQTLGELFGYEEVTSGEWYAVVDGTKHYVELKSFTFVVNGVAFTGGDFSFDDVKDMTIAEFLEIVVSNEDYTDDSKILENLTTHPEAITKVVFDSVTVNFNVGGVIA